jgi:hypothetical protein
VTVSSSVSWLGSQLPSGTQYNRWHHILCISLWLSIDSMVISSAQEWCSDRALLLLYEAKRKKAS